jgi:hypothetical protein
MLYIGTAKPGFTTSPATVQEFWRKRQLNATGPRDNQYKHPSD